MRREFAAQGRNCVFVNLPLVQELADVAVGIAWVGGRTVDYGDLKELLKSRPSSFSGPSKVEGIQPRPSYPSLVVWAVVCVALNALFVILTALSKSPVVEKLVGVLPAVIPLATLHLCFPTLRRNRDRAPMLLGCVSMTYACGRALFFVLNAKHPATAGITLSTPWTSIAEEAAYPLLIAALLWWPSTEYLPTQRFRNLIDLVVGGAGLWAFSWIFLIFPELFQARHNAVVEAVTVARPIFAVLLAVCTYQLYRRGPDIRYRAAARFVLAGVIIVVAVESTNGILALCDLSATLGFGLATRMQNIAWPVALSFFNLGAYVFGQIKGSINDSQWTGAERSDVEIALATRPWYSLAPYTLIPAVAFLLLYAASRPNAKPYELGALLGVLIMVSCLLLRQVLTIKDNAMLLTRLQSAFRELTAKSTELKRTNVELESAMSRLASKNDELARVNEQLAQLVTIDGMTGLENHRAFQQRLRLEVDAAKRHRHPLSLIMADVDFFKRFNDEFGHPAGDEILRQIAKVIMDEVGENAYPARYGGEEFSVVLPYLTASEALALAERVGRVISNRVRVRRRITMSFGVATMEPHWTAEVLVNEADRALYAAKAWGRNRAVLVTDLDRQRLSLDIINEGTAEFDPNEPMGLAAILSAGLRNHPQALGIEPDSQLAGGLLGTLELKDVETRDHSERVMWYAMRLAQSVVESGISTMTQQELRSLAYGSLLHDIGKIGVPEHILKYPGTLDLEMRAVIREHPRLGAQIVQRFPTLDMALAVIRNHHERWDGRGYPSGLRGMDIPLVARIFTVVDALEAMTSKRPYSDPISIDSVTERLMAGSGTNYDPAVIRAYALVPPEEWISIRERETTIAEQIEQTNLTPISI